MQVPRNVGGCVKNSPDKFLLCLKILGAVYVHHKEETRELGRQALRRSMVKNKI